MIHDRHVFMPLFRLGQFGMPAPFADVAPAVTTRVCMIQKDLYGNHLTQNLHHLWYLDDARLAHR